ncbi:type II toxin-antitoxin system HipA family toxin YjjJ [Nitrosomonas sp.]|uniref:type II toxin-antitoxin system HipA family toxin YjjJ n=1 Tax=Nitrosomonas sp. TaxID=42353 RepID=UPI001DE97E42|nr:type II toxin-antitoxin system HipA family toxin YjjJ [Nitrosomonas sp.]MCB1950289.1 type II toxin-antitoxin system HipA family toxin YjjJ [Nitrosomonas sp.]
MSQYAETIRIQLSRGPLSAHQLSVNIGVSQPTISRALSKLGGKIVRIGSAQSIQYTLRDNMRGLSDISIYRVDAKGQLRQLGTLIPVRPEGFVMRQEDGVTLHSDGLPWWLFDMRPQGFLGRTYAARHGAGLGLPAQLKDWTDTHALRALLVHGHDLVGNLLLGEIAKNHFVNTPVPDPIMEKQKPKKYAQLAACCGEIPGSSAGGEQPKFTTYAMTPDGPRYVIVKFSELTGESVSERWRDILLAEHLALETLREADIPAAKTRIVDHGDQRFLEVERFDRIDSLGRRALHSLAALAAEFVGDEGDWPVIARSLAVDKHIHPEAVNCVELLWTFGILIGNSDMHSGNLSFVSEHGRPYNIAPAYDMTPMAFAPNTGGKLLETIPEATFRVNVPNETWRRAENLARAFLARIMEASGFSHRFEPCIVALKNHIETTSAKIERLG